MQGKVTECTVLINKSIVVALKIEVTIFSE